MSIIIIIFLIHFLLSIIIIIFFNHFFFQLLSFLLCFRGNMNTWGKVTGRDAAGREISLDPRCERGSWSLWGGTRIPLSRVVCVNGSGGSGGSATPMAESRGLKRASRWARWWATVAPRRARPVLARPSLGPQQRRSGPARPAPSRALSRPPDGAAAADSLSRVHLSLLVDCARTRYFWPACARRPRRNPRIPRRPGASRSLGSFSFLRFSIYIFFNYYFFFLWK